MNVLMLVLYSGFTGPLLSAYEVIYRLFLQVQIDKA